MNSQSTAQAIKQNLIDDYEMGNRKGLYALTQKLMAYNSNRIEGSTLTSEQTASLFDTGTLVSNGVEVYKAKDIEEMNGHFKMFNHFLKHINDPLSIELIKQFHYQLKNGVFEDLANGYPIGEFKNRVNQVSDIKTTKPSEVESQIHDLLETYSHKTMTIEDIARFHADYEKIHPFQDGNGRTGRMILFKQCLDNDISPIVIRDEDKAIYNRALNRAQKDGDISDLVNLFQKCQEKYLENIAEFVEDYDINKDTQSSELLDIKLVQILKQLDEELVRMDAKPIELNVVGGFALIMRGIREDKDALTDIDYVGPALEKDVQEVSDRIGEENNVGAKWINNDVIFVDSLDELELSTGRLHFEEMLKLDKITINVLDEKDLLRLKVISVDTGVMARMSGDDFTRFKDFEDIKLLMKDLNYTMFDLEMDTYEYVEEQDKTYKLIEDYIEKGRFETMKSIDNLDRDEF